MGPIAAELRKLTTVPTTWVLSAVGWGLVTLVAATFVFVDDVSGAFTGSEAQLADTVDQVGVASILVLVVAVLSMTSEFRHGTVGRTLQITPSRTRVLTAKTVAGVAYAVVFHLGATVVVAALVGLGAVVLGVDLAFGPAVVEAWWQGAAVLSLTAVLGIAVGALLRNQVVAITVTLVWVLLAESLVSQFLPRVGQWLPFQAQQAIFLSTEVRESAPQLVLLDPFVGFVVFVGYVLVAGISAVVLMRVRDV